MKRNKKGLNDNLKNSRRRKKIAELPTEVISHMIDYCAICCIAIQIAYSLHIRIPDRVI